MIELTEVLAGRPGWHRKEDPLSGLIWCFGLNGEGRIVISVVEGGDFYIHDHDADEAGDPNCDHQVRSVEAVKAWLELNEAGHAGPSELLKRLARDQINRDVGLNPETN